MTLHGKRVLLTGATGGVGRAIADHLIVGHGCKIFFMGRDEKAIKELHEQYGESSLGGISTDMRHVTQFDSDVERLADRYEFDILINNAGIFPVGSLLESSVTDFDECFSINIRAPFVLCKAIVPGMVRRGWGRVVNIGSSSAYAGFGGTSIYCSSKHALLGLSRSLFQELKKENVRVFCVSPGSIQTSMGMKVEGQDWHTFITPKNVAEVIPSLISSDSNMIMEEVRLNRIMTQ